MTSATSLPTGSPARDAILGLDRAGLAERLASGTAITPEALAGFSYRGISLGMPEWFDRVVWKTFMKSFRQEGGRVRGYNVRMEQNGIDGAVRPRQKRGKPWIFGHFDVRAPKAREVPQACGPGVVFDYGLSPTRDAVVSLDGTPDLLLGVLYVALPGRSFRTPSYFTLERHCAGVPWDPR